MSYKNIFILFICIFLSHMAAARKAQEGAKTIYQPDGTSFMATLTGDEFGHMMRTAQGHAIVQGEDGYYYYARFEADGSMLNSGSRVGAGADPSDVRASLAIPYEKLLLNASRKRSAVPAETENIVRRMKASRGVTKAEGGMTKHGVVILVNFKDVSFKNTADDFDNLLNQTGYSQNGARGCAKEYFDSQFKGMFDFEFDVFGPVTVAQNRSYYGGNNSEGNDKAPEEMIIEACQLCDAEVDFSLYDDDRDGEVDNVFVFYAGGDEAEYAGDDCIWSHAWYIKDGARKDLFLDGVRINRYACTSELTTQNAGKTFSMAHIGTFCHEYTHTFGMDDLYDTDYANSGGKSKALWGSTSLMDSGNSNGGGRIPPNYNAIEREVLGLGTALTLEEGSISLAPIDKGNTYYRIDGNTANEYYLIECRKAEGWDEGIGGSGLLVYHVDKSRNSAGRSSLYEMNLTANQRWLYNEVNANPSHQCAMILPAYPSAKAVSQIFFPYSSYDSILPDGKSALKFWDGSIANVSISNISITDGTANFNMRGEGGGTIETPPDVQSETHEAYQTAAVINFSPTKSFDGPAKASWGISGKSGKEVQVKAGADGSYCLMLEDLSPSTSYEVKLWFELNGVAGISKTVKFMTAKQDNTNHPYIFLNGVTRNSDGSMPSGAQLPLRVYNPGEDVNGIYWTFDGKPVSRADNGYYTIARSGVLKAEIIYKDGRKNYVVKEITVK